MGFTEHFGHFQRIAIVYSPSKIGVTSLFNHILYFGPRQDHSRFRHIKGLTQLAWKQDIEYDKILFG